jgi:hypothetical protein
MWRIYRTGLDLGKFNEVGSTKKMDIPYVIVLNPIGTEKDLIKIQPIQIIP